MKKNSFTLVELLVVIGVVGMLSSVVMVGINSARIKARDVQRIQEFEQVQKALELYNIDHDKYPASKEGGQCFENTNLATDIASYLSVLPEEFISGRVCYTYFSDEQGSGYKIMCDLEKNYNLEENDGGCYPGTCGDDSYYELFDNQGAFASAEFSGEYWYGEGPGGIGTWALKFEGVEDYVDTGQTAGNSVLDNKEYTLEAWINLTDVQGDFEDINSICQINGFCEAKGVALTVGDGTVPGVYHAGYHPSPDNPDVNVSWWYLIKPDAGVADLTPLNEWRFLAVTYAERIDENKEVYLYVDGEKVASSNDSSNNYGSLDFISDQDSNVFLGSLANWSNLAEPGIEKPDLGNFKGLIDEVRIYDYAIDEWELEENYVVNHFKGDYSNETLFGGNDPEPIAYWPFEEGTGTETADTAGSTTAELKPEGGGPEWEENE